MVGELNTDICWEEGEEAAEPETSRNLLELGGHGIIMWLVEEHVLGIVSLVSFIILTTSTFPDHCLRSTKMYAEQNDLPPLTPLHCELSCLIVK